MAKTTKTNKNSKISKKSNSKSSKSSKNIKNNKTKNSNIKKKDKIYTGYLIGIIFLVAIISFAAILIVLKNNEIINMPTSDTLAIVNKEKISNEELNNNYNLFFMTSGLPQELKESLSKEDFLNQYIDEIIVYQEAKKEGFSTTQEEVNYQIDLILKASNINQNNLSEILRENDLNVDNLKSYLKKQITTNKFINNTISKNINITESEIKKYYKDNKASFLATGEDIRIKHILVESEEKAKNILTRLRKGEDFEKIAKEESIGPSAKLGGNIGIISKGQTVKNFEDAAFSLTVGELSEPIKTEFGWHIIKRYSGIISFKDAKENIKETLYQEKQQEILLNIINNLRDNSDIKVLDSQFKNNNKTDNTCYTNYGLKYNTIIFYHASWCPHCTNMKPIIKELESEGYNFYWVESDTNTGTEVIESCFKDTIQGGVPQFICTGTKQSVLGEMSKDKLKSFADKCLEI